MEKVVKIYYKHLKLVKTLEFNKNTLDAFAENLTWSNFQSRYKDDKDNYGGNISKQMKKSIENNKSFKDIKNAVQNALKNTNYQDSDAKFKEKILKPLKKFLKEYYDTLLKLLQFARAKESIDFWLKDVRTKQVKSYDNLEFKTNFSEDVKFFLNGVEGEEPNEVQKLVKKNLPKQKPSTKAPVDKLKKKMRTKVEKYFKDANKEESRDFQRDIIENFMKNVSYEKFVEIFDSKTGFKDKFVDEIKTMTLNTILGDVTSDDEFHKILKKVNYPEKDSFKTENNKIIKNLDGIFGEKKRLRRALNLNDTAIKINRTVIEERRLGKSDDMANSKQDESTDKDETSDDGDKVLSKEKLEKKIKDEIAEQTKSKKKFEGKFGEDNDSLRQGAAKMIVQFDRQSDNKVKTQEECLSEMKMLNYPCDGKDCSKTNFEEDIKEIKELLIKNFDKCFKTHNVKSWLDSMKYDAANKAFDKDIKGNMAKVAGKKQTPWEKSKVTQEEIKSFVDKNDDKVKDDSSWKAFRDKLKKFMDDEYKKEDRRMRQRVLQQNKMLLAATRRLHFVAQGKLESNSVPIKKQSKTQNLSNIQNSLVSVAKEQLIIDNARLLNVMRRRLGDKLMTFAYDEK